MRFISFENMFSSIGNTLLRFPLTIICVYVATLVTIWYTDKVYNNAEIIKLIYTTLIGGLFFLSTKVAKESHALSKVYKGIAYFITFSIIIVYYLTIPSHLNEASLCFVWISIGLVVIGHLLISFVPYIFADRSTLSFRSYNYQLLLKFFQAVFYTLVLFATLSLALISIEALFDINVKGNTYTRLFIFLAGIFNTTYFLSQYPSDFNDETYGRPKGLKVLAEYIMIPVLIIYTLILYAYIIKVVRSFSNIIPEVRYMIIAFLVFGVFTYLINFFDSSENRSLLSKYYVKLFFPIASPVAILLLVSVYQESLQIGINNELYLNGMIGLWSILLALYIVISKKDDIKWVPISLLLVSLITFFIPYIGICDVTVRSQFISVKKQMIKHNLLVDDIITKPQNNHRIISSILQDGLRHLDEYNKLNLIVQYDKNKVFTDSVITHYTINRILNIGHSYSRNNTEHNNNTGQVIINNSRTSPIDISKYNEVIYFLRGSNVNEKHAQLDRENNSINIRKGNGDIINKYNMSHIIDSLKYDTKYLDLEDEYSEVRFIIYHLNANTGIHKINSATGILLYRNK